MGLTWKRTGCPDSSEMAAELDCHGSYVLKHLGRGSRTYAGGVGVPVVAILTGSLLGNKALSPTVGSWIGAHGWTAHSWRVMLPMMCCWHAPRSLREGAL
jgi:hypothetical protein